MSDKLHSDEKPCVIHLKLYRYHQKFECRQNVVILHSYETVRVNVRDINKTIKEQKDQT